MDYRFGNKAQWRRTVWNNIAKRVENRKEAIVLYLAGPENLDKAEAVRRGFDTRNLIAVEKDKNVAEKLRNEGQLCVFGNIVEVAHNFPDGKKIDVFLADICHGVSIKFFQSLTMALLYKKNLHGTVVVLNLMRGHDADRKRLFRGGVTPGVHTSEEVLSRTRRLGVVATEKMIFDAFVKCGTIVPSKHLSTMKQFYIHRGYDFGSHYLLSAAKGKPKEVLDEWSKAFFEYLAKATLYSYISTSGQVFDSIIFTSFAWDQISEEAGDEWIVPDADMKRQIAAVLAHRTRRLSA